jgi:hypothetical protein
MDKMQLLSATKKLKQYVKQMDHIYEHARETGEEKDFYTVIKPFVDEVHFVLEEWGELAKNFIVTSHPKHLYIQQIDATIENMKEISVQAFFPKTSYSRFKHRLHSIHYILEKLHSEIDEDAFPENF